MKRITITVFLLSSFAFAAPVKTIERGYYRCHRGNNTSICDQKVYPTYTDKKLKFLKVIYSGDCAEDGPYTYPCDSELVNCTDGAVEIQVTDKNQYTWINHTYGIECDFR